MIRVSTPTCDVEGRDNLREHPDASRGKKIARFSAQSKHGNNRVNDQKPCTATSIEEKTTGLSKAKDNRRNHLVILNFEASGLGSDAEQRR